jgi:hypothetical protein
MSKFKCLLFFVCFSSIAVTTKAQQPLSKNDISIRVFVTTSTDSLATTITLDVSKNGDSIKMRSTRIDILKRHPVKPDYPDDIVYKESRFVKELNPDKSFKQYAFHQNWSLSLDPRTARSRFPMFGDYFPQLIDSIASTGDDKLKMLGNVRWSFFEGKPHIEYQITYLGKTRIIQFDFPASLTNSPLFNLLTNSFTIYSNMMNQPNKYFKHAKLPDTIR